MVFLVGSSVLEGLGYVNIKIPIYLPSMGKFRENGVLWVKLRHYRNLAMNCQGVLVMDDGGHGIYPWDFFQFLKINTLQP